MMRRVAVTGIGVISALGRTRGAFWDALSHGRSGIRPMTLLPEGSLRFANGAEVPDYNPSDYLEERESTFLDRVAQFALIAAREAVKDSGLEFTAELGERTAIVTGCSAGGQSTEDMEFRNLYGTPPARCHPLTIPRIMANAGCSRIAVEYGVTGPAYTVSTACSSSNHALGQAFWMVRNGTVDAAIAGGCEAPFSLGFLKAWEAMRIVSPDTCRPFSKDRKGLILGEGSAILILETLEHAQARGAHIWGEIAGFGMSSDAHHITQPHSAGAARAMQTALADARLTHPQLAAEAFGYVNAHGTGTPANDSTETEAIHSTFGAHAGKLLVSSTKSMHGHALGAAGALEAAATLLAMHEGKIPPTANFTERDPACDLDIVPNCPRVAQVEWALSNSFAFGGLNAVLALHKV